MRNKYNVFGVVLAVVALLLAILQFRSDSRDAPPVVPSTARTESSESGSRHGPRPAVTEGRRERQAADEKRKTYFYGDEVVGLCYKDARFFAASRIHTALENQASNPERIREGIISDLRNGWPLFYDSPLDVEFWEFAFKQGIPRDKLQSLHRPSDDSNDWPAWVDKIKVALTPGESLRPYGRQSNRVYHPASPEIRETLLDPESPTRKSWEDPELQRLAALVDRMIEVNEWPAWPEEPDWQMLVDKFIISEIPDLIEKAIEDYPRIQQEKMERILGPDWDKARPGP